MATANTTPEHECAGEPGENAQRGGRRIGDQGRRGEDLDERFADRGDRREQIGRKEVRGDLPHDREPRDGEDRLATDLEMAQHDASSREK